MKIPAALLGEAVTEFPQIVVMVGRDGPFAAVAKA
jgi:hypothetical protein